MKMPNSMRAPRATDRPYGVAGHRRPKSAYAPQPMGTDVQTNDVVLETADGPMALLRGRAPRRAPRRGRRDPGGVRRERPHRGRHPPVRRRAGYHAVAPDFFHRAGGGAAPTTTTSPKVLPLFEGLDATTAILADVDAALDHLRAAGFADAPDRHRRVLLRRPGRRSSSPSRRALGAAVGFYGGGIVTARFPQFPPLVDEARDAADAVARPVRRRGRGRSRSTTSSSSARRSTGAGRHRGRALRRRRARVPLRRARRLPRRTPPADAWGRTLAWFDNHLA